MNFQPFGVLVQALRNISLRLRGWPLISASIAARPVTSAVSPARRTLRSLQVALLYFVFPERREASHVALVSVSPEEWVRGARREASPRARQNRRRTSPHSACPQGRGFPCRCSSPDLPCSFTRHFGLAACLAPSLTRSPRRRCPGTRHSPNETLWNIGSGYRISLP